MRCDIRVDNFMFNPIYSPHHVFDPKPYFFTISFDDCQNLQWRLGLVWLWRQNRLMAQRQIGQNSTKVLVGARSSFRSHQFISNDLEYIHVDGLSAY